MSSLRVTLHMYEYSASPIPGRQDCEPRPLPISGLHGHTWPCSTHVLARCCFQDGSWAPSGEEEEEIMYKWEHEPELWNMGSGVTKELAIFLSISPTLESTLR